MMSKSEWIVSYDNDSNENYYCNEIIRRLIHCDECKHWSKVDEIDGVSYGECNYLKTQFNFGIFLNENYYCASGERKEE